MVGFHISQMFQFVAFPRVTPVQATTIIDKLRSMPFQFTTETGKFLVGSASSRFKIVGPLLRGSENNSLPTSTRSWVEGRFEWGTLPESELVGEMPRHHLI